MSYLFLNTSILSPLTSKIAPTKCRFSIQYEIIEMTFFYVGDLPLLIKKENQPMVP